MTHFKPNTGILSVYASAASPNEILGDLTDAFAEFKARQNAEIASIRGDLDAISARNVAAEMNGSGGMAARPGNIRDERTALAEFGRFGQVNAALSIGGAGGNDLTAGGAAVFPAVSERIMVRQFSQSAIARLARLVTLTAGDRFEEPQDLGEPAATWVGESDARPATTTATFSLLSVTCDELYTLQPITQRLLDDSQYDLGQWLEDRIADKLARAAGSAFMIGDGDKKPSGIVTYPRSSEADSARDWGTIQAQYTGASGAFGTGGADILVDAVYSLQGHYRQNARWVMNSKTLAVVRRMKDSDGRFLWADSLAAGQPATLLGYPVETDESAPDIGANAAAIWFGDWQQAYVVVRKPGLRLLRDPYSSKPNVLFYAYSRVGGALQNSEAIKAIVFGVDPDA
ncbi:phage major capsid protein [Paracoccus ravus]|uniref:phage major capsid protein n=1 Tax=Paracoccus ravus TaxID=2447760 RepID=UPI00142FFED5|nr:phage major capsid protein [Paracoccus ravus]